MFWLLQVQSCSWSSGVFFLEFYICWVCFLFKGDSVLEKHNVSSPCAA